MPMCENENLIKRKKCNAVEVSIYARTPSWYGSLNAYTGALVMAVHFMLHTYVHVMARITVGICVIAEMLILVTYLNKCLRFEVTLNFTNLFHASKKAFGILGTVVFLYSLSLYLPVSFHSLKLLTTDELFLIILPALYAVSILVSSLNLSHGVYLNSHVPNFILAILFAVYW